MLKSFSGLFYARMIYAFLKANAGFIAWACETRQTGYMGRRRGERHTQGVCRWNGAAGTRTIKRGHDRERPRRAEGDREQV